MGFLDNSGQALCGVAEQLTPWFRSPSDKNPNEVYVGLVALPGLQQRARAYVKIFPLRDRGQYVYNEVIAHHLAVQCGLPSPLTFPCVCHPSLLRGSARGSMAPTPAVEYVLGVASVDGNHKSMKQIGAASAARWADVMNWPPIAQVAVFDELMGNDDRHIENLIRRGPHDYVLIDNERILFAEPWFGLNLNDLKTRRCDANILADTIAEGTDELMRQRIVQCARHLLMATLLTEPDVSIGLESLCRAPSGATTRLVNMLNDRRTLLPSLMQWHLQKGDLFQARTNR